MFSRVVWSAVLLTVAITPLIFATAANDADRLPKTLFFETAALLIGAAIVAWDANRDELGKLAARHRTSLILGAAAVLWTALASMTAQNQVVAAHAPLAVFCYAVFFGAVLLFAQRTPGLALTALLAPAVINTIVLLLQWRRIWTPNASDLPGRYGHTGLQGNPDPAGVYLIVPAIAAIAAAIAFRRWRPVLVATSALLLVGLLLTESITVFVSLAAVFVAFIVVVPSRKARIAMIAMIVAGAVVLAAYAPTRTRAINIARWTMEGNFQEVTSFRLPAWGVAWSMFVDHPLTGVGPGGYGARYMSYKLAGDERHPQWMTLGNANFAEAHNDHLQLLAEAGLPGLALFAIALGWVALQSLRSRGSGEEGAFVRLFALPAAVGFAVAALAQFPLHLTATTATAVFAAALALAWGQHASD